MTEKPATKVSGEISGQISGEILGDAVQKLVLTPTAHPQPPVAPTTTLQQDLVTAGQRRVNIIWESTQALIAILVVLSNMIVGVYQGLVSATGGIERPYPIILSSSLFLVVGFYFSRTNHSAVGGVGPKPQDTYSGR